MMIIYMWTDALHNDSTHSGLMITGFKRNGFIHDGSMRHGFLKDSFMFVSMWHSKEQGQGEAQLSSAGLNN